MEELAAAEFKAHGSPWLIAACESLVRWAQANSAKGLGRALGCKKHEFFSDFQSWLGELDAWKDIQREVQVQSEHISIHAIDGLIASDAMAQALWSWDRQRRSLMALNDDLKWI